LTDRQPTAGPATRLIGIGASPGELPPLGAVISELPTDDEEMTA
jgi:hypothetical protein